MTNRFRKWMNLGLSGVGAFARSTARLGLQRLRQGQFLTVQELNLLTDAAQYRADDLSHQEAAEPGSSNVIDIKRIRMRRKAVVKEVMVVTAASQASRLRYMADCLEFLAIYGGQRRRDLSERS